MAARILLVEDVDELRAVVSQAIKLRAGLEVVGEAGNGKAAIGMAQDAQPDIVVLDLGLPDLAGQEVLSGLRAAAPAAQVVIYSGSHMADYRSLARRAEGFVSKQQEVKYLVDLLADLSRRRYKAAYLNVGGRPEDVGEARRFLEDQCRLWHCGDLVDDAMVVLSELVGNAVVHAQSGVEVRLALVEGMLRIEVTDHGGGAPDLQSPGPSEDHGRGLVLVSVLSTSWGVEAFPDGKCVWAEVHITVGSGAPSGSAAPSGSGAPPPMTRMGSF